MKDKSPTRRRKAPKAVTLPPQLAHVNLCAAGIDVGSQSHWVAVPVDLAPAEPVREFGHFTADLESLADWLVSIGVTTVVMESTGVYWIALFEVLEERGLEVLLVNARHVKNVPGRKTDVLDCQWLQQLHTYGLLRGAFRPPEQVCALRSYLRQRAMLVSGAASHIQHMQKALTQMNLVLHTVVSDITGVTGMKIIHALLDGERDPLVLAGFRDRRCQHDEATIAKALQGHYREEHLFALRQSVELYEFYHQQISACDAAIEYQLQQFDSQTDEPITPPPRLRKAVGNALRFDARSELYRMTGVDLTRIDGLDAATALVVIAEIGLNMSRWPTAKHFASWLHLCPGNHVSGGKRLSGRSKPGVNRAANALRMAAASLHHSKSALGAYLRRQKARLGAPKAITATAHKLARLVYSMLKYGSEYVDAGQDYYEQQYQQKVVKNLRRRAQAMGFELVEIGPAAPAVT